MANPAGTVAILHRGLVDGDLLHWVRTLPTDVALLTPHGNQIPRQRNLAAAASRLGDWLCFVDSDTVMPPGALPALLAADADLVGAICLQRYPPWRVCAVRSADPAAPARVRLAQLPRDGLVPVDAVGTGCCLIRRAVFEAVEFPWFRCGQVVPDLLLEDSDFCLRAKAVGIQPHLHAGVRAGHALGEGAVVWPGRDGRPWVQWRGPQEVREPLEDELAIGVEVVTDEKRSGS